MDEVEQDVTGFVPVYGIAQVCLIFCHIWFEYQAIKMGLL